MKHLADSNHQQNKPESRSTGGKRYATSDRQSRYAGKSERGGSRYRKPAPEEKQSVFEKLAQLKTEKAAPVREEKQPRVKAEKPVREKTVKPVREKPAKPAREKPIKPVREKPAKQQTAAEDIYSGAPKHGDRVISRPRTDVPATPTAPVPAVKAGYAPVFLFAGFIAAMAILFIALPKADYSASEKRVLADFPNASAEDVLSGQFGEDFETYFADHFPGRNLWVGVNAYTGLVEGNNGAGGVYKGRDGYLINKPVPTDNQLENNLGLLKEFKSEINVPMSAIFVPSTGYICEDKLPLVHDTYHDDDYFDTIAQSLGEANIQFFDVRDAFFKAYQTGSQLYYRTDHHWTCEGAYTAYREYCKPYGLTTIPMEGFEVQEFPGFYGTTYSKSGFWFTEPDTLKVWRNTTRNEELDPVHVQIYEGGTLQKEQDSMFFYEHDEEDDKYPIFLDGNHARTEITNPRAQRGTIVVIKDSFSHCFAPFLADNYKKVILVDPRYSPGDITQLVREEKPEQVLVLYGIDNFATDTDLGHLWG